MRDALLDAIADIKEERRAVAETEKAQVYLDEKIADIILRAYYGMTNPGDAIVNKTMEEIRNTIDVAIILIAYCTDINQIHAIKTLSDKLGRHSKIKLNIASLEGEFRQVISELDKSYRMSTPGVNDKLLLRMKARAIIEIINDAINSRKSRFK
jgi:hypothetical protein